MANAQLPVYKYDISKILSFAVHGPHIRINADKAAKNAELGVTDDFPLYARTDRLGYEGRSPQWLEKIQKVYNSPRNIRAIFVSKNGVMIKYWDAGLTDNGNYMLASGDGDVTVRYVKYENMPERVRGANPATVFKLSYSRLFDLAIQARLSGLTEVQDYHGIAKFTGTLSKAFSRDWVLNNLEEFYIDEMLFFDCNATDMAYLKESMKIPLSFFAPDSKDRWRMFDVQGYLNGSNGTAVTKIHSLKDIKQVMDVEAYPFLLMEAARAHKQGRQDPYAEITMAVFNIITRVLNGGTPVTWKGKSIKEFPRLKHVGFIANEIGCGYQFNDFSRVIRPDHIESDSYDVCGYSSRFISKVDDKIQTHGILINTPVCLYTAPFSTADIWQFDRDFLVKKFNSLKSQFDGLADKRYKIDIASIIEAEKVAEEKSAPQPAQLQAQPQTQKSRWSEFIDETATEPYEIELNKNFKNSPNNAAIFLSVMDTLEGRQGTWNIISRFTSKGKATYTKLFEEEIKRDL